MLNISNNKLCNIKINYCIYDEFSFTTYLLFVHMFTYLPYLHIYICRGVFLCTYVCVCLCVCVCVCVCVYIYSQGTHWTHKIGKSYFK